MQSNQRLTKLLKLTLGVLGEVDLDVVALDLLAEDEDLLAALEGRDVVGVVDDLQVGVGLPVLDHVRDDRGEGHEAAVGGLQEDLEEIEMRLC